jgi:hypothetical protein
MKPAQPRGIQDFSVEELLWELQRREAAARPGPDARAEAEAGVGGGAVVAVGEMAADAAEVLAGFASGDLIETLLDKQRAIYNVDDRKDLYEVNEAAVLENADSVVAIVQASSVHDNGDGTSTLKT